MRGAFYCKSIPEFLADPEGVIRDALTQGVSKGFYQQLSTQTDSWFNFIRILKHSFRHINCTAENGNSLGISYPKKSKKN